MTYYNTVLFISRNKDNEGLDGFKQRSKTFLTDKNVAEWDEEFLKFVEQGVDGELSRFYKSVNKRDLILANRKLIHYLIDNQDFPPYKLQTKLVSLASEKNCAAEGKWLFDYDGDKNDVYELLDDIEKHFENSLDVEIFKTVSGHGIVTPHGFDTRELLEKWPDVSLHRDGQSLYNYKIKGARR